MASQRTSPIVYHGVGYFAARHVYGKWSFLLHGNVNSWRFHSPAGWPKISLVFGGQIGRMGSVCSVTGPSASGCLDAGWWLPLFGNLEADSPLSAIGREPAVAVCAKLDQASHTRVRDARERLSSSRNPEVFRPCLSPSRRLPRAADIASFGPMDCDRERARSRRVLARDARKNAFV